MHSDMPVFFLSLTRGHQRSLWSIRDQTPYHKLTFEGYLALDTCALDRDKMDRHSLASRALSHA